MSMTGLDSGLRAMQARVRVALDDIPAEVMKVGQSYGQKMEDHAKQNAPWQDRTGAARDGLSNDVSREGNRIVIQVFNTATGENGEPYPLYLETGTAPHPVNHPGTQPYPAIMPAIQAYQSELFEESAKAVMRLLGAR